MRCSSSHSHRRQLSSTKRERQRGTNRFKNDSAASFYHVVGCRYVQQQSTQASIPFSTGETHIWDSLICLPSQRQPHQRSPSAEPPPLALRPRPDASPSATSSKVPLLMNGIEKWKLNSRRVLCIAAQSCVHSVVLPVQGSNGRGAWSGVVCVVVSLRRNQQ